MPKPKPQSEFGLWFRDQFGPRPIRRSLVSLRSEQASLKDRIRYVDQLIRMAEEYERNRNAALLGWAAARRPK